MNFSKKDLAEAFAECNAQFLEKVISIENIIDIDEGKIVKSQIKIYHLFEEIPNPITFDSKAEINVRSNESDQETCS